VTQLNIHNRVPLQQYGLVREDLFHEEPITKTLMLALTLAVSLATAGAAQTEVTLAEKETGLAAVYTDALKGHITASGQVYDPTKLTAAHKTLPFGTTVRVTNTKNNESVVLRITDRGPKQTARVLDISPAAAIRLGINRRGMREVTVEIVALGSGKTARQPAR
jgi:rare lipoprotein A